MRHLTTVQKLPSILVGMGTVSVVSGGLLVCVLSKGSIAGWLHSGLGETYTLGALTGLAAVVISISVNLPTANRLSDLAAASPGSLQPVPAQALASRLALGTRAVAVLLIVATSAMAVARYVP